MLIGIAILLFIYFVLHRIREKKNEDFEKRSN